MVATRRSKRKAPSANKAQDQPKDAPPSAPKRSKKESSPNGGLKAGDACPQFKLKNEEDKEVTLQELIKSQPIIIFMYPRANTPGCTKQACGFRDNYADITSNGYGVYGLSGDKPVAQSTWKSKQQYQYHFLCDVKHEFMKALGVSSKNKITRSHVIVGTDGKLLQVQIGISPDKSVADAVQYTKDHPFSGGAQDDATKPEEAAEQQVDNADDKAPEQQEEPQQQAEDVEMKPVAEEEPPAAKPIVQNEDGQGAVETDGKPAEWEIVDKSAQTAPNGEPELKAEAAETVADAAETVRDGGPEIALEAATEGLEQQEETKVEAQANGAAAEPAQPEPTPPVAQEKEAGKQVAAPPASPPALAAPPTVVENKAEPMPPVGEPAPPADLTPAEEAADMVVDAAENVPQDGPAIAIEAAGIGTDEKGEEVTQAPPPS